MTKKITRKPKTLGKPRAFKKAEDLREAMFDYLDYCVKKKLMPNRAGFCVFVELSRDSYYEYKKRPEYFDTIKRFEEATEDIWIQRLGGTTPTGAIFYLKNAFREDFKDKQEIEVTEKTMIIDDEDEV